MPSRPLFRRLLKLCALLLAAPSANTFGYVSPTTAAHVHHGLGKKIRYILDGGATPIGLESMIVDLRDPAQPRLLRPDAITRAQLSRALRKPVAAKVSAARENEAQIAPGSLQRHYSPHAQVVLHHRLTPAHAKAGAADEAWLFFKRPKAKHLHWLDATGSHPAVARRLFAQLRQLDRAGYRVIHVELARGTALAEVINDRLRRAAAKG